jgi:transposase InsO family protein
MDRWGIYRRLNLQGHWCQNSWRSLLLVGPKIGAGHQLLKIDCANIQVFDWGWYYLSTVMDDYSHFILAWELPQAIERQPGCLVAM